MKRQIACLRSSHPFRLGVNRSLPGATLGFSSLGAVRSILDEALGRMLLGVQLSLAVQLLRTHCDMLDSERRSEMLVLGPTAWTFSVCHLLRLSRSSCRCRLTPFYVNEC